jgi:aspartyl aminopeptidase
MNDANTDAVADLLAYIDASPTPYHAVAESARRLEAAGFRRLEESDRWECSAGDRVYVVRTDGSLIALILGSDPPADAGFRIIGAHTDSPNLRIKPRADVSAHGYRQLAVEPYGGLLLHTWLDRDLSLAGRVSVRADGEPRSRMVLVDFERPLLRLPNLAIHLYRELSQDGLKLNVQEHGPPVMGLEGAPDLPTLVSRELRTRGVAEVEATDLLAFDLMLYDTQRASLSGAEGEFIHAARLDNLASCHAALRALLTSANAAGRTPSCGIVLYDHEEVGSRSARGAGGPFLVETLTRIVQMSDGNESQAVSRAFARSMLVSADMAHAVHPNYADKHEKGHRPVIGGGPVVKTHSGQSYASDAETVGRFRALCASVEIEPQFFVSRSDLPCGSTIGPISAARAGIRTVDVGNPMLSMHSCREMAGARDVDPMIRVLTGFFQPS